VPFIERAWNFIFSNPCTASGFILIIIAGIALIVFIVRKSMPKTKWYVSEPVRIAYFVAIGLIIVAVFAAYGLPTPVYPIIQPHNESEGLYFAWHEDQSYSFDLNDYFKDPDNDALTYQLDEPLENISVTIKESIVTLQPDKDWFGTRRARFIATDTEGDSTLSPRVTFEVVDVPDLSLLELYLRYCAYINALILIIILTILYFTPFSKVTRTRKGPQKVAELGLSKEEGYLYYVDQEGDVSRSKMKRNAKKRRR